MTLHDRFFYNIRHVIPIIGLAGTTMFTSCAKTETREEPPTIQPEIPIVQRDSIFTFSFQNAEKALNMDTLKKYANDKTIGTIYLVPTGHWNVLGTTNIKFMRDNFLQPRIELSKKMRGRGDFDFQLGAASMAPADSLWYVENGWTINKNYQR